MPAISTQAARAIVAEAFERGSADNLTVLVARVDTLPDREVNEVLRQQTELPSPPPLAPRMELDGYKIVRELHASARSHVFLATDTESGDAVVLKTLATEMREDTAHLERFLMEDWVAQRISNAHVLRAAGRGRKRSYPIHRQRSSSTGRRCTSGSSTTRSRRWRPCAASSSRSPTDCWRSIGSTCCTRTCGRRTS